MTEAADDWGDLERSPDMKSKPAAPEKIDLAPCPCGQVPADAIVEMGQRAKWGRVMGSCCGEWSVEFRNGYTDDAELTRRRAVEAWNEAPRQK
jgi:hypothetical protein